MFGIIIAAVATVLCGITCLIHAIDKNFMLAFLFGLLSLLNLIIFIDDIQKYNEPKELHRSQIEDVVKYDVDTITTISGRDTTRTYTIYYYKY